MTTSPISLAFKNCKKEKRPALITFTVAGDNSKKNSLKILNSIARYADILELSFLHNCPIADGGQIQNSTYRSLENGTTLKDTFQIAKKFKNINPNKPLILMGYYNLIYQNGENNFLKNCKLSKVDGLIVVDLPWPENKKFAEKCKKKSINFVQLLSPTTSKERIKKIIKDSHDMIYYISMLSTTGGKLKVPPKKILENYSKIKKINNNKNCVIGFGITNHTISSFKSTDGIVVGSEICKEITNSLKKRQNPVTNVSKMVRKLKSKII
ncbi:MAG: tryptophan synthase subunit alpha [Pelagibacteraceae bacterium TMED268]|nr:MAG: tryptophan synthase subunit alpha [Pelagibacteraceae bacterium TMED268]